MSLERQRVVKKFEPHEMFDAYQVNTGPTPAMTQTFVALYLFVSDALRLGCAITYETVEGKAVFTAIAEETDQEYKDRLLNEKDKIHAQIAKLNKQAKEIDEELNEG